MDETYILKKGTGMPYLAIFDGDGKPIIDELINKPIGLFVTKFTYVSDEDEIDNGSITLNCSNPDLPSNKKLMYRAPLQLQWGWLFPDGSKLVGPLKKVIIKKRKTSFTSTGVEMVISIACSSSFTKSMPPNYSGITSDFGTFVQGLLNGDPAVEILDYDFTTDFNKPVTYERID